MKNFLLSLGCLVALISCKKDAAEPVACMNIGTEYTVFDEAFFENCSEDATSYTWSVNDGSNSVDYSEESPRHTWTSAGTFDVTLAATNEDDVSDETTTTVEVSDMCYSCIYIAIGPSSEQVVCASEEGSMDAMFAKKDSLNNEGYSCDMVQ